MAARAAGRKRLPPSARSGSRVRPRVRHPRADRAGGARLPTRRGRTDPRAVRGRGGSVNTAAPTVQGVDTRAEAPHDVDWLRDLRATGAAYDEAVARLHALLLRAARFEVGRRRPTLPHLRGDELDDIAHEAADDALMSVLAPARRLPRREPLHDVGVQVRAARGGREAAQARVAGARGAARARELDRCSRAPASSRARAGASSTSSSPRCSARSRRSSRRTSARARRARAERRADRRPRRPDGHDPRRALQDAARRAAQAARTRWRGIGDRGSRTSRDVPRCSARPSPRSAATSASTSSTATSSSSWPARTPTPRSRARAPTSPAVPPAARSTRACARAAGGMDQLYQLERQRLGTSGKRLRGVLGARPRKGAWSPARRRPRPPSASR